MINQLRKFTFCVKIINDRFNNRMAKNTDKL
jgi:hypothetical protein